ncbi:protein FANTASTIC FOUR 1-like [Salvia divinorum]|uniref:Protein FANTASTIC FOUR 1-like n=1 Tax=Salvia divinorum TaxID=28513 RepID=A0ABD1GSZ6_SALDI
MSSRFQPLEAREKCLSSSITTFPQARKLEPYTHPLSKPSPTPISLDMCTEGLCTESGATGADPFLGLAPARPRRQRAERVDSGGGGGRSFPPPLASGLRVHSHREGGRLVIRASPRLTAERGDGRLRLSLARDGGCEEGEGGKVLSARCNGDRTSSERMHTFQLCVVGS